MSALLRALMVEETTPSAPNLAVIANSTFKLDSEGSRRWFPIGVTANLLQGKTYKVSLDYEISVTNGTPTISELRCDGKYLRGNIFNFSGSSTPVDK